MTTILAKITYLGVLIGLIAGLAACSPGDSFTTDPNLVANNTTEIAIFDLPEGYSADFSANMMGYSVEAYSRGNGSSHLYLIQFEQETDREKLAKTLDELVIGANGPQTRMTVIESRTVTLGGQAAEIVFTEGPNSEGVIYRQAAVAFQGNGGPALLVFSELLENWDEVAFDNLLASIQ